VKKSAYAQCSKSSGYTKLSTVVPVPMGKKVRLFLFIYVKVLFYHVMKTQYMPNWAKANTIFKTCSIAGGGSEWPRQLFFSIQNYRALTPHRFPGVIMMIKSRMSDSFHFYW